MIRSKRATAEYRDAWDRVFGAPALKVGDRVVWHVPRGPFERCDCSQGGIVGQLHESGYVNRVQLYTGGVIDPSISPDLLKRDGDACPLGGGPLIPVGASVD